MASATVTAAAAAVAADSPVDPAVAVFADSGE